MSQPLAAVCFDRWRRLAWRDVLAEMATLFHLAVQIEDVKRLFDAATDKVLAHKPKPKSKPARKRARRAKKIAQAADSQ
ncbi:MAG: hypothetical protein ACRD9W_09745 [Terriglobia bacterium]